MESDLSEGSVPKCQVARVGLGQNQGLGSPFKFPAMVIRTQILEPSCAASQDVYL